MMKIHPNNDRVLHIVPALFGANDGIVGGAERYALELARYMAERVPTTLVTFGQQAREFMLGNLKVTVLSDAHYVRGQRTNPISASLVSELRKANVIHCHQQHVLASSLSAIACRMTRRKVFVTDLGGGGWDISGYVSTDRWFHGHLHISEYSRAIASHDSREKAHVILGGVDLQKFSPHASVPRNGKVLFVGRILPHKGIDDLIKALPEGMTLEIIGRPYAENYLRDLKAMAEGKRVVFRHECDDEELVRAYRESMCIALPSVYRTMYGDETKVPELLGQTLLEGMACGAPAVCTDVASLPEVVENEKSGFVVPPNSPGELNAKLSWLREHKAEAKAMGNAARQRAEEKFSWPAVVDRCLKIYTGVRSVPRADRGPRAGSPRGVVNATGSRFAQLSRLHACNPVATDLNTKS
jgi:glycosyltransferase involved in cell wall biosynthesis